MASGDKMADREHKEPKPGPSWSQGLPPPPTAPIESSDPRQVFPSLPRPFYGRLSELSIADNCFFKAGLNTIGGGVMGAIFGVVFGQFDNDGFNAQQGAKAKLRFHLREMRQQSFSFAKQFAVVGGVYTIFECHIEKHRGKRDIWNAISAGCLAGGTLAARAGPQAAAFGCAGFAAFSGAIEHFFAS